MFFLLVCQSFEPLHSLSKRGLEVSGGQGNSGPGCCRGGTRQKKRLEKTPASLWKCKRKVRSDGAPTAENGHRCQTDGQQGPSRRLRNGGDGDVIKGNSIPRLKVDPNILTESPTKDQKVIVGNSRIDG